MNILNRKQHQRGVGLIEVLIALVVIAVGVIAVLGLQGTLMSGSATTKARGEALALAREKTEELRNAVELGQFDADLVAQELTDDPDAIINGVNAQFTRRWSIAEVANIENTRELVMQVIWNDAQGVENRVELNTLIAYASPLTSVLNQRDDSASIPGEPDTGYEGLHPQTEDATLIPNPPPRNPVDTDFGITDVLYYSNGHVQVRIWDENCAEADKILNSDGVPIESDDGYLCAAFTAFGGTLLRFHGKLYLDFKQNTLDGFALIARATSPSYCAMKPEMTCEDSPEFKCVEYQCYASGDCSIGGGEGCPGDWSDLADSGVLPDLNGGWQGRVGHFFYDNPQDPTENYNYKAPPASKICMGKEWVYNTDSDPVLVDNETISRSYYGERTTPDGPDFNTEPDKWREGINRSYSCHNTLFVEFNQAGEVCNDGYEKMISEGIVWNSFKDDKVIRELAAEEVNDVLSTDATYCDLVAIYGAVSLPGDGDIEIVPNKTATPAGKTTFDTVIAYPDGDSVPGECVAQVSPQGGIIYACNFIDDPWSGYITASADPRPYDVTTTDPDTGLSTTETVDFTCEGSHYYTSATGRIPGQDLSIICFSP